MTLKALCADPSWVKRWLTMASLRTFASLYSGINWPANTVTYRQRLLFKQIFPQVLGLVEWCHKDARTTTGYYSRYCRKFRQYLCTWPITRFPEVLRHDHRIIFLNFCGRVVKRNMIFAAILLTRRGTWCDFNSLRLANYVKYTNRSKTRVENTFMLPVKKCDAHKVTALLLYRYDCKAKNTFLLKVKQLYNLLSTWNIEPLPCVRIEYLFMLPEKVFSKNVHPFLFCC